MRRNIKDFIPKRWRSLAALIVIFVVSMILLRASGNWLHLFNMGCPSPNFFALALWTAMHVFLSPHEDAG